MHTQNVMNIINFPCRIIEGLDNRGPDNCIQYVDWNNQTKRQHFNDNTYYSCQVPNISIKGNVLMGNLWLVCGRNL